MLGQPAGAVGAPTSPGLRPRSGGPPSFSTTSSALKSLTRLPIVSHSRGLTALRYSAPATAHRTPYATNARRARDRAVTAYVILDRDEPRQAGGAASRDGRHGRACRRVWLRADT